MIEFQTASKKKKTYGTKVENVGFCYLPDQINKKNIKKGFEFSLLVAGDSGLGKSTLLDSLFGVDLNSHKISDINQIQKTTSISVKTAFLEEKGIPLKLTTVDTPGFGNNLNNTDCLKLIEQYIDEKFFEYYKFETKLELDKSSIEDSRVHFCLYFIPAYVRGLRPIDVKTMISLQNKVNMMPVIAKSDSLTQTELKFLKKQLLKDIEKYNIKIYKYPLNDSDDEEEYIKIEQEIQACIPFAIIGSNTLVESGNKKLKARVYPWGIIDIESDVCDFTRLRNFLCCRHMQDLKDLTHNLHYENYRKKQAQKKSNDQTENLSQDMAPLKRRRMPVHEVENLLKLKDLEIEKLQKRLSSFE